MTVNERIEAWFAGREDEYVSALTPLDISLLFDKIGV